jgi:type IV pilus assembly protein PilB
MSFSDDLKEMVLQGASAAELKAESIRRGMNTLRRSGLNKVINGTTSIEEVLRVTAAD